MLRPYKQELHNIVEATLGTYGAFVIVVFMYYHETKLKESYYNISLLYITIFTIYLYLPGILYFLYICIYVLKLCGCHVEA